MEFFDKLKEKKIPFTIASASIKENIDFFVKEFGLAKWIHPEDSVSGIQSGYAAGCRNIVVIDSANKAEEYKTLPGVVKVTPNFKFN